MKVSKVLRRLRAEDWFRVKSRSGHRQMKKYAIVIEDAGSNLAAYVLDLPGCVATGDSEPEVERPIREAIVLHLEGMVEDGLPIPEPAVRLEYVEIDA